MHIYLVVNNETTLEMGIYGKFNPFDRRGWYNNLVVVFGTDIKTWLLPIAPKDQGSDGIDYPIDRELMLC